MMKTLYTLLFIAITTSTLLAQTPTRWQPYVRAGVGASRAVGEKTTSEGSILYNDYTGTGQIEAIPVLVGGSQWLFAANAGAGITIPVSRQFVIQAELNVEQKGSGMKIIKAGYDYRYIICDPGPCSNGYLPAEGKFSSRLTYLTLPILAGYRFGKITLLAGPYVAYKLGESIKGTFTLSSSAIANPLAATGNRYKNMDWGISTGAVYAITRLVSLDFRYNQGFLYAAESYLSGNGMYSEPIYNQSAQLGVRYSLLR